MYFVVYLCILVCFLVSSSINLVLLLRELKMEIKKNQEEVFSDIQNWFDDVNESFLPWIAEGKR